MTRRQELVNHDNNDDSESGEKEYSEGSSGRNTFSIEADSDWKKLPSYKWNTTRAIGLLQHVLVLEWVAKELPILQMQC